MVYTNLTRKAMIIAYTAHFGQVDKAGVPYIYHPVHLAEQMNTEIECIVALLHDVVEDTNVTFEKLEKDFPNEIINILKLLTRDKNIDYFEYINNLKSNEVARKVKIADIKHNMTNERLKNITSKDIERNKKYQKALEILT